MAPLCLMTSRVVLFGPDGQVGSRLLQTLSGAGFEVTGIDRARCDFMNATAKDIATMIRAVEPQLVINAAAYTAVDMAESEKEAAQRLNAEMPEIIAASAQEQGVPFLHFSTDYVFDGLRDAPYREDAITHPLNVYGTSKLAGEQAARRYGAHVFRLQWVFDSRGKNFFLTMKKFMTERKELRIVSDQLGSPSNALHIAQAVAKAAPLMISGSMKPGIYHLSAAGHTSWHGFACAIASAIKSEVRIAPIISEEYPTPAARPKDVRLDVSTLASYGIAMPHWREGLTQAMNDTHANS